MALLALVRVPHHDGVVHSVLLLLRLFWPLLRSRVPKPWLPTALDDDPNVEFHVPVPWLQVDQPFPRAQNA